jgi:hypothetical protein
MVKAQDYQAKQTNKKRRIPDFSPEDKVYVIKKS